MAALWYDDLVRIVFGNSMQQAQACFLSKIPSNANVLVLGGGTGRWMAGFLKTHPECRIVYIDASSKMTARAKRNADDDNRIVFKIGTQDILSDEDKFDAVITFCYLDLFDELELRRVIARVNDSIRTGGQWLVADFLSTKLWHRCMLTVMYVFFHVTTNLRTRCLPDWRGLLRESDVKETDKKLFYGNFIMSALYTVKS